MKYLFSDPRPDLPDTMIWDKLLKSIHTQFHTKKAYEMQKLMWSIRSFGTMIKPSKDGLKLVPLYEPDGAWTEQDYKDISQEYLRPVAREIKHLLDLLR